MALKKFNPTTPGRRGLVLVDRSALWKGKPERTLTEGLYNKAGRNNNGRIKTLLLPVVVAIGAGQLLDSMLISYGKDDHFHILNLLTKLINKPIFLIFKLYVIFTLN